MFKLSRPRFWLYLAGPYLLGYTWGKATVPEIFTLQFFLHGLFFLIPANIFLYGLVSRVKYIRRVILFTVFLGVVLVFLEKTLIERSLFISFFVVAVLSTVRPFEFKHKPGLDILSNCIYGIPGILAFYQASGHLPSTLALIAIFCWTSAMRLFTTIPTHGKQTTAALLGKYPALVLCISLWCVTCVILLVEKILIPWSFFMILYPLIPALLLINRRLSIPAVIEYFPWINTVIGMVTYLLILTGKPLE